MPGAIEAGMLQGWNQNKEHMDYQLWIFKKDQGISYRYDSSKCALMLVEGVGTLLHTKADRAIKPSIFNKVPGQCMDVDDRGKDDGYDYRFSAQCC